MNAEIRDAAAPLDCVRVCELPQTTGLQNIHHRAIFGKSRRIPILLWGSWSLISARSPIQTSLSLAELELSPDEKVAFVFGNEASGVSQEAVEHADASIFLPMKGFVPSLNVSVCTAIVLQHLQQAGLLDRPQFTLPQVSQRLCTRCTQCTSRTERACFRFLLLSGGAGPACGGVADQERAACEGRAGQLWSPATRQNTRR